jgi:hypothetical protein
LSLAFWVACCERFGAPASVDNGGRERPALLLLMGNIDEFIVS